MIIKFGKASDCKMLQGKIPEEVIEFLKENISILDNAYGSNRNHYKEGGYIIYAENKNDIQNTIETVVGDICEWSERIKGYTIALHLLGDDFSVVFCYPNNTKGE